MLLSAFMTFCEGYLGIRPTVTLWSRVYHFKFQGVSDTMSACGVASSYVRKNIGYPGPKPLHPVKKW